MVRAVTAPVARRRTELNKKTKAQLVDEVIQAETAKNDLADLKETVKARVLEAINEGTICKSGGMDALEDFGIDPTTKWTGRVNLYVHTWNIEAKDQSDAAEKMQKVVDELVVKIFTDEPQVDYYEMDTEYIEPQDD